MKNFPDNPRRGSLAGLAGAGIGLMALLAMPATAQQYPSTASGDADQQLAQPGPVDLLATIQDNTSGDGNDDITFSLDNSATLQGLTPVVPTINTIEEAVDSVTELPVQMVPATSEPTSPSALAQQTEAAPTAVTVTDGDDAAAPPQPESQGVTGTATISETAATPSVNLQKRAAPNFGVAVIGVESRPGLNATIWRDTPADRAAMLLGGGNVVGASASLSALAHDVVAQRAVPPVGGEAMADELVAARLAWLAAAGRSRTLEEIVGQLPNDPPWLEWKQWLVETQLMSRRDEEACRTVMYQVSRTFEPFWHKAKVICSAATGDVAGAQFAADILTAMGVDDPIFTALVAQLLTDADAGPIDPSMLEPLHIVLMDAAHAAIDVDGLAALADGSIETAVGLRYLDADARLVSTWRALDRGLVDHDKAAKLWRSAQLAPDAAGLALARHQSQPSALTRALVWRALDNEKSVSRLPMIVQALDADIASGAGLMMAPLYAELSREGLEFGGATEALAADAALAARMAMLMGVTNGSVLPASLDNDMSRAARGLLSMASGGDADMASFAALDLWHLLALIPSDGDASGVDALAAEPSWFDLAMPDEEPATYLSVSPLMLRAVEQAAAGGRVAETVLLAHRLVGPLDLAEIHPADVARIVAALQQVGQPATASAFAGEVVTAHILAAMSGAGEVRQIAAPTIADTGADSDDATGLGASTEAGQPDATAEAVSGTLAAGGVPAADPAPAADGADLPAAAAGGDSATLPTETNADTSN